MARKPLGWTLETRAWTQARLAVGSEDWRVVGLLDHNRARIPAESGIYMICAYGSNDAGHKPLSRLYNAIYVGHSKNLRGRFRDHVRGYKLVRHAYETFRRLDFWYLTTDPDLMDRLEDQFWQLLGPPANQIKPGITAKVGTPVAASGRYRGE